MADKDQTTEHDEGFEEEFEFEEAAHDDALASDAFEESAEESESEETVYPEKKRNLTLPVLIGLAILGFIGWKGYGMLHRHKAPVVAEKPMEMKAAPTPVAKPAAPPPPAPSSTVATIEGIPSGPTPQEEALTKLQKKLDEQQVAYQNKITTLEKTVESLSQNSANANKGLNLLQHEITTLSSTLQTLESQIRTILEERQREREAALRAKQKPKVAKTDTFASPTLTIYAVIPGRAWLRSANGKTITVTEGDPVGEYGKVVKIDPSNGMVTTSSGVTLR